MKSNLNIKSLLKLFDNTNTSYKFLYFYSLIKIIKKDNLKKTITFKEILNEMLILAWLPSFQFNLNFREQDKIKEYLIKLMKNSPELLKINKPTNSIIKKIYSEINKVLKDKKILEDLEIDLLDEVVPRLIRPFYKTTRGITETYWYKNFKKILNLDYEKEKPLYLINFEEKKIILNLDWLKYIQEHFHFLELWVLNEWHQYMQYQNRNSPSLYQKLRFPELQRNSLDKQRKFWKKIINKHEIKCIFSKQILTENNFDIDHFICWNFLAHDQEWNLIPVLSEINRSKNNKIPDRKFIGPFVNFKIQSFKYAKSILSPKKYKEYLAEHSNFINFSYNQCFTPSFKSKYNEEINSLANKAINQGFEKIK